jgi:[FeFe] hydrogenase H-cluster maturation GTPase HydF
MWTPTYVCDVRDVQTNQKTGGSEMGLNDTPSANRVHIGFFGCRNAGKSSLVNAVTGQSLAVVSDVAGTTTDPVYKSMELLPLGPVVIVDTPGIDDAGSLGELRVAKTRQVLSKVDVAVLVVDATKGMSTADRELVDLFHEKNINHIIAYNKSDASQELMAKCGLTDETDSSIWVSAEKGYGIHELKELIGKLTTTDTMTKRLVGDLLSPGDVVVLVIPIDSAAPKGRLILPQQQVIRDVLEAGAISVVCRDMELADTLERFGSQVSMVITDSQAFGKIMKIVPEDIYMTSFSILMARFKGQLETAVLGAHVLDELRDEGGIERHEDTKRNIPRVLIAEGCTHHRQCDDIGTVKLPGWIRNYTGLEPEFTFVSGTEFPDDLTGYDLIIHCGGCMLNEREMKNRQQMAQQQGVPMTNYGTAIAHMNGILERSLRVFNGIYDN